MSSRDRADRLLDALDSIAPVACEVEPLITLLGREGETAAR